MSAADAAGSPRLVEQGGAGAPILLVHGFGGDRMSFLANQGALAASGRVFSLDLPGHGDSLGLDPGAGDPAALAEKVAASLDAAGLSQVAVVGHSLGGGTAIEMAKARPDLVRSLLLIAPAGLGGEIDHEFVEGFPALEAPDQATELLGRLFVRPQLVNRHMVARVLEQLGRPGARDALRKVAAGLTGAVAGFAPTARAVAALGLPRLVVWGEGDAIARPDPARLGLFGGGFELVAKAGHMPHVEAAPLFNRLATAFLAGDGAP